MGKFVKKAAGFIASAVLITTGVLTGNSFLIKAGIVVGLSSASALLAPKPKAPNLENQQGQNLQLKIDTAAIRQIVYGTAATSGSLVYREAYGPNNKFMSLIIAVAGHEIESFGKFTFGGIEVPFSADNATGTFAGVMQRFTHLGTDAQTVDTDLDANSAKWTAAHRLQGIAYYHFKLTFDPEKFKQGFQNPVQIIKGRKIYDPRKDDTNGGSGTHRREDPTTWEFSNNPVLCIVDYLRGIRINNTPGTYDGILIAGMGFAETRIDWPNIIAEANICDEQVPVKAAGFDSGFDNGFDATLLQTQTRYTCDGIIDPQNDHRTNLNILASSMAGNVAPQSGKWRVYAGAPRAAIKSRTTDDIIGGISFRAQNSLASKSNGVRGVFASEDEDFQIRDYTPLQPSALVVEDGGEEQWLQLDLPFTTNAVRAQRISKIFLLRNRFQRQLDSTFNAIGLQDQVMDTVNFTYTPFNITNEKYIVQEWAIRFVKDDQDNVGFVIQQTLLEEDDSIYGWQAPVDEQPVFSVASSIKNEKHNDQRNLPALNVAGSLVSTDPTSITYLRASETGGIATINIAAHTLITGFGQQFIGAGSVTGLLTNQLYYIYIDDPLFEGGSVTYIATTQIRELSANSGRHFAGSILTPALAAPTTSGSSGGGVSGGTGFPGLEGEDLTL